ncbi:hypothetical protein SH139x_001128 [Planctomycetaceae bacterium SH139]
MKISGILTTIAAALLCCCTLGCPPAEEADAPVDTAVETPAGDNTTE